ncbi:MAG TPA: hypothetical protein VM348_02795, partial [Brevundimonas sp.]|nr:hypothetical protein [Brevundimonas sp.]
FTTRSTSAWVRWVFSAASFSISSDLIIGQAPVLSALPQDAYGCIRAQDATHPSPRPPQEKAPRGGLAGEMSVNGHKQRRRAHEKGGGIAPAA